MEPFFSGGNGKVYRILKCCGEKSILLFQGWLSIWQFAPFLVIGIWITLILISYENVETSDTAVSDEK